MKKKNMCKKIVGICLVAMMAVASVGTRADAATFFDRGYMYGGCTAYQNKGTAYTVVRTGETSYGTISAEYTRFSKDGSSFKYGASAGGVHGASVTITYKGNADPLASYISSMHEAMTIYGLENIPREDYWSIYQ